MIGNRTGTTYRLGDSVTVKLIEAAPVAGALRFEILSEGRKGSGGGGGGRRFPNQQRRPKNIDPRKGGKHRNKGKHKQRKSR